MTYFPQLAAQINKRNLTASGWLGAEKKSKAQVADRENRTYLYFRLSLTKKKNFKKKG